jgi:N-acylneuraminate cytidylyltransferase
MLISMANIAIITARGGSKRIPRKNIKLFRGKPIIAYSIETALKTGLFEMVMVSTDDEEIANISKQYGAQVPFLRSNATSDDHSPTADVLAEVIARFQENGQNFNYACGIYPTAPLISNENLVKGYELLNTNNYTSVFPVCSFSYPIFRALQFQPNRNIEMIWSENLNKRSQDLPVAYHDAGQFYWVDIRSFMKEKKLFTPNSGAIVLDELSVQDIDNETDWKIAELKHSLLYPVVNG